MLGGKLGCFETMHDTAVFEPLTAEPEVDETASLWIGPMVVRLHPVIRLTPKKLERFCQLNSELRIEQTAAGELIVMPPASGESGQHNAELTADFVFWARKHGGRVFDSSAGFTLPNTAMRAPDVSWVSEERFGRLTKKQLRGFTPICPDFVLELRSQSDRLPKLQEKMVEYIANGAQLGWLIDPLKKQVFVYRPDEPVEHLKAPTALSGEPVLAGFTLDLTRVW